MCENLVAALAHRIGKHSVCGSPLHSAYVIVLLAGLGGFFAAPGSTFAVGFFTPDFMDSLGMSRTALSFCWTLALLLTALFMPLSGRAVDKFGPRWVLFGCTIIFSLDNFLMAYGMFLNLVCSMSILFLHFNFFDSSKCSWGIGWIPVCQDWSHHGPSLRGERDEPMVRAAKREGVLCDGRHRLHLPGVPVGAAGPARAAGLEGRVDRAGGLRARVLFRHILLPPQQ